MKKFTKGCLITALILFIIGCIFCLTFGMMGGFEQIDSKAYRIVRLGGLGNMVIGYSGNSFGIFRDDDWSEEEWTDMYDIDENTRAMQTKYSASDITDIDIDLGGESVVIEESENDHVWISTASSNNRVNYGMKGGTFRVYSKNSIRLWKRISNSSIHLYLPKGMTLDSIDLSVGAGKLKSMALNADEINMDIGAGKFDIDGISAHEVKIEVGAGKADINDIIADKAVVSAGAGKININGVDVRKLSLDVGMGNIDMEGKVSGDVDVDCGMGSISMRVQGSETDYNYEIECAMGAIRIGDNKYSGLASERSISNGSSNTFEVECSMGSIDIDFE